MICFNTYIDSIAIVFFEKHLKILSNYTEANALIKACCGINVFFNSTSESLELLEKLKENILIVSEPDRREYGDFQTNEDLALQVVDYVSSKNSDIEFILEPTCGKGNFILASIQQFKSIKSKFNQNIFF